MLPSLDGLVEGFAYIARRERRKLQLDKAAIAEALSEAKRLAGGHERDEPAALFFACARRGRAFGGLSRALPLFVRNQARAVGLELQANDTTLSVVQTRVACGAIEWEELRAWFAGELRAP